MIASVPATAIPTGPGDSPDTGTGSVTAPAFGGRGSSLARTATTGSGDPLDCNAGVWLGRGDEGDGGLATVLGGAFGVRDGACAAAVAETLGIGWIETYRPSQTIALGAYFHGVKKRLSWAVVSFVFGAMS